jgi:hypothetical protein
MQISASPASFVDLIGGLRYDYNDPGSSVNGRLGSVIRLSNFFFVSALYLRSFLRARGGSAHHGRNTSATRPDA